MHEPHIFAQGLWSYFQGVEQKGILWVQVMSGQHWSNNTGSFGPPWTQAIIGPGFIDIGKGFVTVSQQKHLKSAPFTLNWEDIGLG